MVSVEKDRFKILDPGVDRFNWSCILSSSDTTSFKTRKFIPKKD